MEIDLTNAKPCPECRQCLTTDPKCSYCNERDRLRAELAAHQRWEVGFRNIVTILIGARKEFDIPDVVAMVGQLESRLTDAQATIAGLREAAEKIRHWHDWGRENEGMVVSSESVRGLWGALSHTPAQHRAAIEAGVLRWMGEYLRRVSGDVKEDGHHQYDLWSGLLSAAYDCSAEADRREKEA